MFFMDCDEGEISEIINALETSKSSDLLIKAVKKASNFLVPHLTKFFALFREVYSPALSKLAGLHLYSKRPYTIVWKNIRKNHIQQVKQFFLL